jgi:hypothetical protein
MSFQSTSIDDLDGIYRSLRRALGVGAFGIGAIVLPPGTEQVPHFIAIGAAGGYVDGDAELVHPADAARVEAMANGDVDGIRRR